MSSKFTQLPTDLVKLLLVHLNFKEIYRFLRISERYHQLVHDENLWSLYAKTKNRPASLRDHALLDHFGYFVNPSFHFDDDAQMSWYTHMAPSAKYSMDVTVNGRDERFDTEQFDKIFFRGAVRIQVPHRGRPETLPRDLVPEPNMMIRHEAEERLDKNKKTFTLEPDTSVGSTLKHVLEQIYKNMYDLKDTEINKSLSDFGIHLTDDEVIQYGCLYEIEYNKKTGIYSTHIDS